MKLTARLKRGRKTEWWVLEGGAARHTVAEINRETEGTESRYQPYLHLINASPEGLPYALKKLVAAGTLAEAVEAVREELNSRAGNGQPPTLTRLN
jgi:hypothetical protein